MTFINYNTRKKLKIWDGITGPVFHSDQASFGHFTLEAGINLPAHNHPHEQWTHLIEGELEFVIGNEKQIMTPGITTFIPSNMEHSAKVLKKSKVIDCFMPVREDFVELEKDTA